MESSSEFRAISTGGSPVTETINPESGQVSAARSRRAGMSRGWVAGALVFGLLLGAAGTLGAMLLLPSLTGAQPSEPTESALAASQWFAEDESLPEGVIEPGTRLKIGDAATVLLGTETGERSVATITVTAVTPLDTEDAEFLKSVQPALTGQRLFRIDYTVQAVSGDSLAGIRLGDAIAPVDAEGAELLRVPISGWKSCGDAVVPAEADVVPEGSTEPAPIALCAVAASPEGGAEVAGALFAQPGGPYSVAAKGQLTWLP